MKHLGPWYLSLTSPHPTLSPRGRGQGEGALLALICLLPGLVLTGAALHRVASATDFPAAAYSSESSTPDCDSFPPEPFPARLREKHLKRLGVDRWHAAGYRGKGIKIAVLDSGFRGYRAQLGKALPAYVTVRSFRSDGNLEAKDSQHGILCSEVLHALAPEAELLFANWEPNRPDQFLEAARWSRQQGARILSCSLIMPSWSDGEGGGAVHEKLAQIIGPGDNLNDLLFFASAGNTARRHWCGPFRDCGEGCHEWQSGKNVNTLTPWGNERISVELYWHPGADYELSVSDYTGGKVGSSSVYRGADRSCSVVHFKPQPRSDYRVKVRLKSGQGAVGDGQFHLAVLGGGLAYSTARGSIACPADGASVLAVGAVNIDGQRAGYSSCGPNSPRPKPDLMAPAPFHSLWRNRPFTGTSAAAPQAAALAALCWTRHPDWSAAQIRHALLSAARDLGPPGHDYETGYGLISLIPDP